MTFIFNLFFLSMGKNVEECKLESDNNFQLHILPYKYLIFLLKIKNDLECNG